MPNPPSAVYTVLQAALADPAPPDAMPAAAFAALPAPLVTLLPPLVTAAGGYLLPTPAAVPCAVFPTIPAAVRAAVALQRALQGAAAPPRPGLPVRLALHRGPLAIPDGLPGGPTLDRLAHLLATGHGGQILLSQAVTLDLALTPPTGVFLRDLGRHRLADLTPAERVAQVTVADLPADFPPLRSLDAFRHNLPVHPTSFVGRSTELATLRLRLADAATGGPRLLTLIGPGGTGKTRLALHAAAAHLAQFAGGVQLVELAPLADPALLPQAVAAVLGVREEPARPLLATLTAALQARHLLLLLDNCEHLIQAAAELTAALLSACPRLVILPSSREALGLPGESVFRVPPLALPDLRTPAEAGRDSAAGRLFLDRACAVRPDLVVTAADAAAVTTICRRLDGIPLALELAAAQVREVPVAEIAARLDDRFRLLTGGSRTALPRHQTLQALIDWSWDLLRPAEQRLLARLGVFVGGWTAATASAICANPTLPAADIPALLTRLVNTSLVLRDEYEGGRAIASWKRSASTPAKSCLPPARPRRSTIVIAPGLGPGRNRPPPRSPAPRLGYWLLAAEALEGRAALAAGAGEPLQAARLFAAAAAVRTALGTPLTPAERESYEPAVAAAQAGVDPAAWAAAWASGARLDLQQAIAEACAVLPAA